MPLLQPVRQPVELAVADRRIADTSLPQRARFLQLVHSQNEQGECTATIAVIVTMYAQAGTELGPALTMAGFAPRRIDLVADNNCLVDAQTGAILLIREGQSETDWQAAMAGFEQPTMLQGDFFEYLRDNGLPGTIRQMIEQHITNADTMGRFS